MNLFRWATKFPHASKPQNDINVALIRQTNDPFLLTRTILSMHQCKHQACCA
jgi:hypothetical protein